MSVQPVLVEPLAAHRFDTEKLFAYLTAHVEGIGRPNSLRQFQGGQSNPTFLIDTPTGQFVLRKRPPGTLLPSAHQIQREYRIQKALEGSDVPVPRMLHWCSDAGIIGTEFYVMEYVCGRVFHDAAMPGAAPEDRRLMQCDMIQTIAAVHAIPFARIGLGDYGRGENYLARQVARWSQQYETSKTELLPDMEKLIAWLGSHIPAQEEIAIVHGDFRPGNMVMHESQPRILAVLDWELSTLGHPLADLAYCCMPFHMPADAGPPYGGYLGLDAKSLGIMTEADMLSLYCARTGRGEIANWPFFVGFSLFRSAAISEGVYARALAGNAADAHARSMHAITRLASSRGWQIVGRT